MVHMAEEFKKYKDILAREQKEFREEMERGKYSLAFSIRQRRVGSEKGVGKLCNEFCNFSLLNFMVCSLSTVVFGYYSRGWIQN